MPFAWQRGAPGPGGPWRLPSRAPRGGRRTAGRWPSAAQAAGRTGSDHASPRRSAYSRFRSANLWRGRRRWPEPRDPYPKFELGGFGAALGAANLAPHRAIPTLTPDKCAGRRKRLASTVTVTFSHVATSGRSHCQSQSLPVVVTFCLSSLRLKPFSVTSGRVITSGYAITPSHQVTSGHPVALAAPAGCPLISLRASAPRDRSRRGGISIKRLETIPASPCQGPRLEAAWQPCAALCLSPGRGGPGLAALPPCLP